MSIWESFNWPRVAQLAAVALASMLTLLIVIVPITRAATHRKAARLEQITLAKQAAEDDATEKPAATADRWSEVTKRNMFAPPPPKGFRARLSGVLGDSAIFDGGKFVKVGESHQGAKLLEVGPDWVEIEFEGEKKKLQVFTGAGGGRPAPPKQAHPNVKPQPSAGSTPPVPAATPDIVSEPAATPTTQPADAPTTSQPAIRVRRRQPRS